MSGRRVAVCSTLLIVCLLVPAAWGQALWAYYPIHENDFGDYSGSGHDGTAVDGAATVRDPVQGWVAAFNVQGEKPSRINCGTNDPSAGGQLTVAAWLLWHGGNGNWQGIAGKSFSYDDRRWIFQLRDTDGIIQWGGADNASLHIWSSVAPAVDEWQHVAGTCDGKTSRIYINGEKVGEGAGRFAAGAANANVTLGFGEDRSDYDESLNGALDEIYLFTRGLGQQQVQDLANGILPVFNIARDPSPADGDPGVMFPMLSWTAGDGAVLHRLYVGTTPDLGPAEFVPPASTKTTVYVPTLEAGLTYYWRVDEVEKDLKTIHAGNVWSFTMQALTAYLPNPADGAVDSPIAPDLTWQPGQGAIEHHVYFGTRADDVNQGTADVDKGTRAMADVNFAPGVLEPVTVYYWRVDEILGDDVVMPGSVWSFTTCLPIDDFESYTDDVGQRIFQTWIDGCGYTEPTIVLGNGTGSTVGHAEPPFAEQEIVHGGLQSMPMDYNNVELPHYSEAQRIFSPPMDWTINGANALVLYVRGKATNKPGQFYVTVKDASNHEVFTGHSDPLVVTKTAWVRWEIPLTTFSELGVDAARIKEMAIGVTNELDPATAGAGSLFIDDIKVIKAVPQP